MQPFKKIIVGSIKDVDRVQTNVATFANTLLNTPILDGVLLKDVVLSTTETNISHTLGRKYQGWIIVNKNAQQDIWESSSNLTQRFIALTAAGSVTVSIWVF